MGPFPHLTLHRASAGSGKTYALAKIFIRLFISIADNGKRRLRSRAELNDSLSHILAITFTNKATAEMKQRIISALSGIAEYDPSSDDKAPDYFNDFIEEFQVSPEQLRNHARLALEIILNNFSDFKVSTIDSFFQTVLRTFAYETNLKDNYGVEIDTTYIYLQAIDAMMEQIDLARDNDDNVRFWFKLLMDDSRENGRSWNVFQKRESNGIYSKLREALSKFEKEDYKEAREGLDKMTPAQLRFAFETLEARTKSEKERLEKVISSTVSEVISIAERAGFGVDDLGGNLKKWCKKILAGEFPATLPKSIGSFLDSKLKSKAANKHFNEANQPLADRLYSEVAQYLESGKLWAIYRVLFPYMALMNVGRHFIADLMNENNAIVLAETNSLLRSVISDDDTPFIYERLGGRLNHLLVDEFQDTSGLQWENLRPLIGNSLGMGHESLLIGDAKQSIYRFRNADPDIIMKVVPNDFPHPDIRGKSALENTNHRSDQRIVQFNNLVFSQLPQRIDTGLSHPDKDFFTNLYATAVQQTKNGTGRGYVRLEFAPDEDSSDSDNDATSDSAYSRLGNMIDSMLKRGYYQKDIAVLVRTKNQGRKVIDALIQHNASREEDQTMINFVSEESLTISSSRSVETIIACLRNIASGAALSTDNLRPDKQMKEDDETGSKRVDWKKIRTDLSFFIATHPELTPEQQLDSFFASADHGKELGILINNMQATTLPSLVEALAKKFIPDDIRNIEAPFLAAFQDAVLDYCNTHISDIGSFLNWWDKKGNSLTIASPADTDAVQIMTVHKSKGIEFPVVIIPECDWATKPAVNQTEWKWVNPEPSIIGDVTFPEKIPVLLNSSLLDTPHESQYLDFLKAVAMDSLNALYVAFTRAVNELYVFLPPLPEKKGGKTKKSAEEPADSDAELTKRLAHMIIPIIENEDGEVCYSNIDNDPLLPSQDAFITDDQLNISFGEPLSESQIEKIHAEKEEKKKKENGDRTVKIIKDYPVNTDISYLKYTEGALGLGLSNNLVDSEENEELELDEEELDPRSEGNLLHSAMEFIATEEDIDKALLKLKSAGLISFSDIEYYRTIITEALNDVKDRGWFSKDMKILRERQILLAGDTHYRPDRLIINPRTSEVTIVDYKFGRKALKKKENGEYYIRPAYRRQVWRYMQYLRKSGRFSNVTGYLWYPRFNTIVPITSNC